MRLCRCRLLLSPWNGCALPRALLFRKQQIPHLELCSVELRLGGADRALQHLGNLMMLIPFDLMQGKDCPATCGKLLDRRTQSYTIDDAREGRVSPSVFGRLR